MAASRAIEVDEDLVEGVGVRLWVTLIEASGLRSKVCVVLDIDDARTLHTQLEDALDEYARRERLIEQRAADAEGAADYAIDRMREEQAEAGRLK